jgi:hypothetical protein
MAELKTQPNDASVVAFLQKIENETKRKDALAIHELMKELTGESATMWGGSIVGYGSYHYKYASGREGDWFQVGFSPRKQNLSLYIMSGFSRYPELMAALGKYKTGKSCLYVNKLEDINLDILKQLITESVEYIKTKTWP